MRFNIMIVMRRSKFSDSVAKSLIYNGLSSACGQVTKSPDRFGQSLYSDDALSVDNPPMRFYDGAAATRTAATRTRETRAPIGTKKRRSGRGLVRSRDAAQTRVSIEFPKLAHSFYRWESIFFHVCFFSRLFTRANPRRARGRKSSRFPFLAQLARLASIIRTVINTVVFPQPSTNNHA